MRASSSTRQVTRGAGRIGLPERLPTR
jgi:hypothetical protein